MKNPQRIKKMTVSVFLKRIPSAALLLFFIFLVGMLLRLTYINWDSYQAFHPDERNIAWAVTRIHFFDQLNPKFFAYGGLPIYLYRAIGEIVATVTHDTTWLTNWGHIVVLGRYVSATLSTISIYLIYLVGSLYFSRVTGLASAAFLAFSPWAIREAHFATTETMLVFFLLLLLREAAKFSYHHRWSTVIKLGLIQGLALGAKTTSLLFMAIPATSLLLSFIDKRVFEHRFVNKYLLSRIGNVLLFVIVACITWFITSPYTIIDQKAFLESMRYETGVALGKFTVPYTLQFVGTTAYLYQLYTMLWQTGPTIIIGIVGLFLLGVYAMPTRERRLVIFLSFPLLYGIYAGTWFAKFSRYNVPFLPFVTLTASWIIARSLHYLHRKNVSRFLSICGIGILVGFVGFHTLWGLANWTIYLRPQTRIAASTWIFQHIPPESVIYTEHWNDGLPVAVPGIPSKNYNRELLTVYEPDTPQKLSYYVDRLSKGAYIILSTPRISRTMPHLTEKYPLTSRWYKKLFNGELGFREVATFTSYPEIFGLTIHDDTAEETIQVFDHPTVRIFHNTEHLSVEELRQRLSKD